jgi:RNA polymerase sigma-70 factor (ECF subfamily)
MAEGKDRPGSDDARLVRAAIRGDDEAFRELVGRYAGMVAAIAYAVTGDAEAARDLAQEVFAEAFLALRRLRSARKFAGWLAGIARRKSVSWVRARARSRIELSGSYDALAASGGTGPGEDAEREETRLRVMSAVLGLPAGYREVIILRCLEGREHAEICEALGISQAALDKRLSRAKTMLRESLGDLAGG